jgi:uncharacterized phage-associated protein
VYGGDRGTGTAAIEAALALYEGPNPSDCWGFDSLVKRKVDFPPENRYVCGMLDSITVANRLIDNARADRRDLTPMQILKLVYLAHGWMLGLYGRPLIRDEIQAWQYGPVIPKLYQAMKDYRSYPVTKPLPTFQSDNLGPTESNVVEQVYHLYGDMTGPELSRITHAPGSPWAQTYDPKEFGTVISNDLIEDHYRRLAEAHGADTPSGP